MPTPDATWGDTTEQSYNTPQQLQALHAVQLDLLLALDRVCRTLGLRYQLAAGTLLGAVRHQGFIPWDSDIDVTLPRPDFDRLLREAPALLDADRYFLQHAGSDPAFPKRIATLRRQHSEFRQIHFAHLPMHHGIHIDIMPFDFVAPDRWWGRIHLRLAWAAMALRTLVRHSKGGQLNPHRPRWQHQIARIVYPLTQCVPDNWYHRAYDTCLRWVSEDQARYVTCLTSMPLNWKQACQRIRPVSEYFEITTLNFEGHAFPAPINFHQTLSRLYGNYQALPPASEQVPKHRVVSLGFPPEP